jgi:hypothetical protein
VSEQHVVVLAEEAHRRRCVGVGPRRVGQVEELLAVLVGEGHEPRAQPFDHGVELGQA